MTHTSSISLKQLESLPLYHRAVIPSNYLDPMGHMNVRWYVALFDDAVFDFLASFGLTTHYFTTEKSGIFALQQLITYRAEVHAGETVAIRIRLLGRSAKRVHFIFFMINETTAKLACTMEVLSSHADLVARKTSPFPAHIANQIDAILAEHNRLDWEAPLSGALKP